MQAVRVWIRVRRSAAGFSTLPESRVSLLNIQRPGPPTSAVVELGRERSAPRFTCAAWLLMLSSPNRCIVYSEMSWPEVGKGAHLKHTFKFRGDDQRMAKHRTFRFVFYV